jgi:hypothetical protein
MVRGWGGRRVRGPLAQGGTYGDFGSRGRPHPSRKFLAVFTLTLRHPAARHTHGTLDHAQCTHVHASEI